MSITPKKKNLVILVVFALIGASLYAIFLPFLNIRKAVGLDDPRYKTQEIVINSYNPLKPRISLITKVEDGYLITVEDYQRNGLDTFQATGTLNGQRKGEGFDQINSKITNKTLEETIKIVKEQDQSNTPFIQQKSDIEKEYIAEENKPVECRKPVRVDTSYSESDLIFLFKDMTYNDSNLLKLEGETFRDDNKNYLLSININDSSIIKYNLYFGNRNPAIYNNSEIKLQKLTKVYSDCREEEIPLPEKQ